MSALAPVANAQPGSNSRPTPDQELDQIDIDMKAAEQAAALAQSHLDAWKISENAALIAIYDVWKDKEHRTDLLKPFCDRHNITWHGSMERNRFLPIVKHMFPNRTDEDRSQYSQVMAYAWEENTPSHKLPEFIGPNLQKTYKKYLKIKQARKVAARSAVVAIDAAAPFLDHVYNAMRLMLLITYRGQATATGKVRHSRSFILRNRTNEDGEYEGVIETAFPKDTITAPAARMTLERPIEQLQGIAYLLTDTDAQRFVDLYPDQRGWMVSADHQGMAFQCASGIKITGVALGQQHEHMRVLHHFRSITTPMQAELHQIAGYRVWFERIGFAARRQWDKIKLTLPPNDKSARASYFYTVNANALRVPLIPKALDFNVHHDYITLGLNDNQLRYNVNAMLYDVHDMFTKTGPVNIEKDRRLLQTHARKLFGVLADEGTDALFYFANTDEDQGAFVCELSLPAGQLVAAYPTVMGADLNWRIILDDIDLSRIANTGAVIPVTARSAATPVAPTLKEEMADEVSRQFGAYIVCHRPADEAMWRKRRAVFARQLTEWMERADIHLHLRLSGWSKADEAAFEADYQGLLAQVEEFDGSYSLEPAAPLIHNRIECLKAFYASEYDWGIMMDDDAILYGKPQHNSAWNLFPEMAKNGLAAYREVDVFFPNNPGKAGGGFNAKYAEDPALYAGNHVFERNPDLKGSMFVVRNFRKDRRHQVLPDSNYLLHGEDTLFATEAIKQGCTVMKCWNINLKELSNERDSHFAKDRVRKMIEAHRRIAEMYAGDGLRMKHPDDPESKTLERRDFYDNCWKARPKKWAWPKP